MRSTDRAQSRAPIQATRRCSGLASDRCNRARMIRTYVSASALLTRRCGGSSAVAQSNSCGALPSYSSREGDVSTSTLLLQDVGYPGPGGGQTSFVGVVGGASDRVTSRRWLLQQNRPKWLPT